MNQSITNMMVNNIRGTMATESTNRKWVFVLVFLLGCGSQHPGATKEASAKVLFKTLSEEELITLSQKALESYFHQDLSEVWKDTKVNFVSERKVKEECDSEQAAGCCVSDEKGNDVYVDENTDSWQRCALLIHEFTHAIAYQVFEIKDGDTNHKKFDAIYNPQTGYARTYCEGQLRS